MARNEGDGSWKDLLITIYGRNINTYIKIDPNSGTDGYKIYNGIIYSPISIILNGDAFAKRGSYGYYFSSKIAAKDSLMSLWFYSDGLYIHNGQVRKGNQFSLRCVAKVINKNCL